MNGFEIRKVQIAGLTPHPRNARKHPRKQVEELIKSVERFGQIRPLVVDDENVVLCGNCLLEALLEMGVAEADAYVMDGLSEEEKLKLMLSDNKIADLGVDSAAMLEEILATLDDYDIPGFDADALEVLYGSVDDVAAGFDDAEVEGIRFSKDPKPEPMKSAKPVEMNIERPVPRSAEVVADTSDEEADEEATDVAEAVTDNVESDVEEAEVEASVKEAPKPVDAPDEVEPPKTEIRNAIMVECPYCGTQFELEA